MKRFFTLIFALWLAACSAMIPYKDQNLDYLQGIEKDPASYRGRVVAFGGEVKGITEDTLRLRVVLKIDAPLYYYATGKGDALSYEMLLVSFNKRNLPQMTGIKKGHTLKVLARVSSFETRKSFTGKDVAVLHLIALALADRSTGKDFFRPETPDKELYLSWKAGKLFFEESAQDVIARCPKQHQTALLSDQELAGYQPVPQPSVKEEPVGIVYDEEEAPFIPPPDSEETQPQDEEEPSQENAVAENNSAVPGQPQEVPTLDAPNALPVSPVEPLEAKDASTAQADKAAPTLPDEKNENQPQTAPLSTEKSTEF